MRRIIVLPILAVAVLAVATPAVAAIAGPVFTKQLPTCDHTAACPDRVTDVTRISQTVVVRPPSKGDCGVAVRFTADFKVRDHDSGKVSSAIERTRISTGCA